MNSFIDKTNVLPIATSIIAVGVIIYVEWINTLLPSCDQLEKVRLLVVRLIVGLINTKPSVIKIRGYSPHPVVARSGSVVSDTIPKPAVYRETDWPIQTTVNGEMKAAVDASDIPQNPKISWISSIKLTPLHTISTSDLAFCAQFHESASVKSASCSSDKEQTPVTDSAQVRTSIA